MKVEIECIDSLGQRLVLQVGNTVLRLVVWD